MEYRLKVFDQQMEMNLIGDLDLEATELFEKEIYPKVASSLNDIDLLKVDMNHVAFVDSTGVGLVIQFVEWVKKRDVNVKMVNIQEQVYEIFQFMQVNEILGIEMLQADT
ncbi:anti-sigma B factor antagonist/stage II sporulation protein AA (anti-sigma F factor antagonist) [Alkalibacillus flavidus]|uniref:Anti-sigma B factor antagonist/stage II sporulation protein AA (Anti-sigma F factor antagonist) n=1 Tax=Alkalibacillus flavidus TaxID=546021 RepID=A0ABV2KVI4_9BACI